jgi:hypothetical protein
MVGVSEVQMIEVEIELDIETEEPTAEKELAAYIESPLFTSVLTLAFKHRNTWKDKPIDYWYYRLMEEVGELGASLAGRHEDPPQLELLEIASIAMNFIFRLHELSKANLFISDLFTGKEVQE